ncbi:hypothetical protein D3C80_1944240 [compost metagenome]
MNSCAAQILQHIVGAAGQGIPGAGSRTDIERDLRFTEFQCISLERMPGAITPFHGNDILRQVWNQLRMLDNDITPELHRFTTGGNKLMNLLQER